MNTSKKKMKKIIAKAGSIMVVVLTLVFASGSGVILFAQETAETPPFVDELTALLESRGWSEEEVFNLAEAAKELEWEQAEGADPEVVALALELGKKQEATMEPLEQAQLALELALTAVEMESLGYNERVVARAALNGVRDIVSDIKNWKQTGKQGNLGELIRNRLRNEVHTASRLEVREQVRVRAQERSGGPSESGFSQVPSGISDQQPGNFKAGLK